MKNRNLIIAGAIAGSALTGIIMLGGNAEVSREANQKAAPAQARIFKDKWIEATLECISYSSKMNCDRAEGAAAAYGRSVESDHQNSNTKQKTDAVKCAASAEFAGLSSSGIPLGGIKLNSQNVFRDALDICKRF